MKGSGVWKLASFLSSIALLVPQYENLVADRFEKNIAFHVTKNTLVIVNVRPLHVNQFRIFQVRLFGGKSSDWQSQKVTGKVFLRNKVMFIDVVKQ